MGAMRWLLLLLVLAPGVAFGAVSNVANSSRDSVSLISQSNAAVDGHVRLALHFVLRPGWHVYWSNPGDAGLAPGLLLDAPAEAGALEFPPPELLVQDGVTAFVLSGDVVLPFAATGVGGQVNATAHWLVCADVCVPEHARLVLPLAGGVSAEAGLFTPSAVVASPFAATIARDGTLTMTGMSRARVAAARFFPLAPGMIDNDAPQVLAFSGAAMVLRLPLASGLAPGARLAGVLELTDAGGRMQALAVDAAPVAHVSVFTWLGLAFLGGLILNLMPCVFPVLAMKALSLTRLGGAARHEIRREALGYVAGVLTAMLGLAVVLLVLRWLGATIGWGFQLQSPVFVAVMAILVLAIALNLAGVFAINFGLRLGRTGNFVTGLLAVAVATPCTAPFMGGAIAAALVAPVAAALGFFLCLGLGLAAPFMVIAALPGATRLLPRPGQWMVTLQRLLAVPMFATFVWLAWVFATQVNAAALPAIRGAEPYTAARLAALRAEGRPVFVDMTAAWCITCLVNERAVLTRPDVQRALIGTTVLVGDWTNRSEAITEFLQENGRDGVPLYVFYPPRGTPAVLPQILTAGVVEDVVR
jgi:cytochrome c biogenesis protein CcdA